MKKQGPPPSFDDIQAIRKRNAGEPGKIEPRGKKRKIATGNATSSLSTAIKASIPRKPVSNRQAAQKAKNQKPALPIEDDYDDGGEISLDEVKAMDGFDDLSDDEMDLEVPEDEFEALPDSESSSNIDSDSESVFDSDEEAAPKARFSEDEDDSYAEEQLTAANIEGLSKKLDLEQAEADAEAEKELQEAALQTNIQEDGPGVLDDAIQTKHSLAPDLQLIRTRMTDTIRILSDFANLAEPGKSRTEYTSLFLSDICSYFGYTRYLAEKLFSLFSPAEAFAFFEANESPRPIVLRTNTLKTNRRTLAQALINRGVVLEPVGKWTKVGLQVFESAVPIGATPETLSGQFMLQAAASFLPVQALAPQSGERVLDMAAAPGGKTTYISALMRNTGCIFANDSNRQRAKGLIGNIHRLGCKNTVVTNLDAKVAFPKILGGFDRVLLDAPCSGTGVIGKDPSVKTSKTERDFLALPHMQKQLLLAAIDSTNHASETGGYIVYSTCSVTVEENEGVVQYALSRRPNVKIVDTGLGDFGSEGFRKFERKRFDERMALTRRYFPHKENVDGFFVCKLKKTGPSPAKQSLNGTVAAKSAKGAPKDIESTDADIGTADYQAPVNGTSDDGMASIDNFGGFEDEEDEKYIARAERNWLRRRGVDPRMAKRKGKQVNGSRQSTKGAKDRKRSS